MFITDCSTTEMILFIYFFIHLCCFISDVNRCMSPYFNTTTPKPTQHAAPHSSSPTTSSRTSPAFHVPRSVLNPIEHIWDEWDSRVRGRVNAPANVRELFQALQQAWVAIQARVIHNLKQSMPYKC